MSIAFDWLLTRQTMLNIGHEIEKELPKDWQFIFICRPKNRPGLESNCTYNCNHEEMVSMFKDFLKQHEITCS
jgi:hypothetical protein